MYNSSLVTLFRNIAAMYGLTIAQMILPLVILPYMTRVLSVESFGLIAYVGTVMYYFQLCVDFGFMLSATKEIVNYKNSVDDIGEIVGDVTAARIINAAVMFIILCILIFWMPLLRKNYDFVLLNYAAVVISIFLFDFLFRGLEEMQVITYRFLIMRIITIALTFVVVKSDGDILWVPGLTIIGDVIAVLFTYYEVCKRKIKIRCSSLHNILTKWKDSSIYFLSDIARTFESVNTLLIGAFLPLSDVAFWSLAMRAVGIIQSLYSPVMNGLYPRMIAEKSWKLLQKIAFIFVPVVAVGCVVVYFASDFVFTVLASKKYLPSAQLLRWFIPLLFVSFLAQLYGWPALASIGKVKQVTSTTVGSLLFQMVGLVIFIVTNNFTLFALAMLRNATETLFFLARFGFCLKYRSEFRD